MSNRYKKPVRAVLLAAGQGKRMKSDISKVLHPVLGIPILGRLLAAIDSLDLEHVHIVIGHAADQVEGYLRKNPPKTPWSTHLQSPQLGTGHALMQVAPALESFEGALLVSVADCPLLSDTTLAGLIYAHLNNEAAFSLLTTVVDDAKSYGRIVRDEEGVVAAIVEHKDATDEQKRIKEINPAIYCLEWPTLKEGLHELKNDNQQKEYYLTDLLAWSRAKQYKISDAPSDWREVAGINSRKDLMECNQHMHEQVIDKLLLDSGVSIIDPNSTWIAPEVVIGQETTILPGCYITGKVEIGESCVIGPNTQITGPAKIGPRTHVNQSVVINAEISSDCKIGPFAHVREQALISDHCRIGNFVEIKKSQIANTTNVSHLSYIGDASIGHHVNIGAGTITANYDRLSGKKSKTVIGNNSSTGSNSVLVAPVFVGEEAMVAAGTVVTKPVPDGALCVARADQRNIEGYVERKRNKNIEATSRFPAIKPEDLEKKKS